jgi:hypothetical protein
VNVLELSNADMGAFRLRLLRKGEQYGLHHRLVHDKDEPVLEFYGPVPLENRIVLVTCRSSVVRRRARIR